MTTTSYVPFDTFRLLSEASCTQQTRAAAFAAMCRINTLHMIAQAGSGHVGTSFSSLDIMSWLFANELDEASGDVFFSSKGHDAPALYATLIGLGKLDFDLLHRLRQLGGLPGHPDVGTPGMIANTGSLGMGISKAKGFVWANRLANNSACVYVMCGDGELQEGQIWESLPGATNAEMGEIIVIIDHNKIQSDTWVTKVMDLGDIEARFFASGWHVQRCDGHDLEALRLAFSAAKLNIKQPSVIVADTIKGKGVSFMQWGEAERNELLYPFHSGAPNPEIYDRALEELSETARQCLKEVGPVELSLKTRERPVAASERNAENLLNAYANALLVAGGRNEKIISLDGDLVLDTGQIPFRETYPERFIECGIAEQDMVSQAGGLALKGYLPIVHSFACFLSTRPNEHFYNNASEGTKIVYVGSLAGVVPGGPGHSHQSVRDIAALSGIPGLSLIEPSCSDEVELAMRFAIEANKDSTYIRLSSIPCEIPFALPDNYQFQLGRGVVLEDGVDVAIIAYGPVMLREGYKARAMARDRHNISMRLINLPWLNRVDPQWLGEAFGNCRQIITLDNHYIEGGQGAMIASSLVESGQLGGRGLTRMGLTDYPVCGPNDQVLAHHGLNAEAICDVALAVTQP